jgi:CRISPR/Cas system CMR-associated protein Cmr1 (group 7 of RAMP superfamily)
LRCRIITPFFTGSKGLSVQLFRSGIRWFWRAIKCSDNLRELRKLEQKIFGRSKKDFEESRVGISIEYDKDELEKYKGINLLYSTTFSKREREFIKDGFEFEITLDEITSNSFDEGLNIFLSLLWASIYLGGFGKTARKGGGNLEVIDVKGNNTDLDFIPKAKNSKEVATWIKNNFKIVQNILSANVDNFCFSYPNLCFSRFIIDDFWNELKNHGEEHILNMPKILEEIKKKIIKFYNPSKIIFFGSRARGDAKRFSDIDIAIDTDKPISIADIYGPVDLINFNRITDENFKNKIKKEGVIIWKKS